MLTIFGNSERYCDGLSRRSFLRVGSLGIGGLSLPALLQRRAAAAQQGTVLPGTAIIYVELAGGPSHLETYDPKPAAPIEFRGPLGTVNTALPGVQFSELMPQQAKIADKLAIVRSISHDSSSHGTSSHLTQTGYYLQDRQGRENSMPSIGSITAKVRGSGVPGIPAYVAMPRGTRYGMAAYIGKQYNPLETTMNADSANFSVPNISLNKELQLNRLSDRQGLLATLDHQRRLIDPEGIALAQEEYTAQAFEMVTGARAQKAFDISQENDKLRDRYGRTPEGQNFLLARRLVEAGATFVTIRHDGWDMHGNIERAMKARGPVLDQALAALVSDLYDRGLQQDVLVVAMGEFGRTPRVNQNAGRDHWGSAMSVLLAGGKFRMGQIIGATNSKGEGPADKPYRPEHVLTMMYRHLGIDSGQTFNDRSGRPRYVLETRGVIDELV